MAAKILTNHIGYTAGEKGRVVIQSDLRELLIDGGTLILQGLDTDRRIPLSPGAMIKIDNWRTGYARAVELEVPETCGTYGLTLRSAGAGQMLAETQLKVVDGGFRCDLTGAILDYFKNQRCTGEVDEFDRNLPFFGDIREGTVDVHGGWYDASGDVSKYLSHLGYSNYMGPQQTPLVVWTLLEAAERGESPLKEKAAAEALYGADFLMRMLDPEGYFYEVVFDRWSKDLEQRNICSYATQLGFKSERWQASFRQGGGMAVAALARTAGLNRDSEDYTHTDFRAAAERAYSHLKEKSVFYLDDLKENIIDDYCALTAGAEMYKLTSDPSYLEDVEYRIDRILMKQDPSSDGFWYADDEKQRPFFHASDEGLVSVSLLRALKVCGADLPEDLTSRTEEAVRISLKQLVSRSAGDANPFGYPKQVVKPLGGERKTSFFFPHVNESGYWWQGENARLGSLCALGRMARETLDLSEELSQDLIMMERNWENWLLGLNPFDAAMMKGWGRNNPLYHVDYPGLDGGICNGITSSLYDENDIALCETEDPNQSWRWGEQWIPHTAWWLTAFSLKAD